jgi:hypothetical protein
MNDRFFLTKVKNSENILYYNNNYLNSNIRKNENIEGKDLKSGEDDDDYYSVYSENFLSKPLFSPRFISQLNFEKLGNENTESLNPSSSTTFKYPKPISTAFWYIKTLIIFLVNIISNYDIESRILCIGSNDPKSITYGFTVIIILYKTLIKKNLNFLRKNQF